MTEEQENALLDYIESAILETWGQEALDTANIGWFVDEVDGMYQSKIYTAGVVYTVWYNTETGEVLDDSVHEF